MSRPRTSVSVYREYFREKVAEHGESLRALDYGTARSQQVKFRVLADGIRPGPPVSILDVGCGFGDFLPYLRKRGIAVRRYVGVDLLPEVVDIARRRNPGGRFEVRNVLREGPPGTFDYVVANGIFYLRAVDSRTYLTRMVRRFWRRSRDGVLFNARSVYTDPRFVRREPHLFQYDPREVLRDCLRLSRAVVLRHDYLPHEFTMYLYREGRA